MTKTEPGRGKLIAPCGMNYALCSRYFARRNGLPRSQGGGCRPEDKRCSYLFEKCTGINGDLPGNRDADSCHECEQVPCRQIDRMDRRYQIHYGMSVKANLERIQAVGVDQFAREQAEEHGCDRCGGLISVHNGKCFHCDTITKLVEKRNERRDA